MSKPLWTVNQTAERLAVKPTTVYAYVSRGLLTRVAGPDGRSSRFDPVEVEQLAGRARHARAPEPAVVVESELTEITSSGHYYRGRSALELASSATFESVAGLLWNGVPGTASEKWLSADDLRRASRAATAGLPESSLPLDYLRVAIAAMGAADPLRFDPGRAAVIATAQAAMATMVAILSDQAINERGSYLAARLLRHLSTGTPKLKMADVINAAMVLMADHELAASTFAARIAASTRADPYSVIAAGLSVFAGPLHGGASLGAEALLEEIERPADAARVIGERLRRGELIPGFGHAIYDRDPRADLLLDLLRDCGVPPARFAVIEALREVMASRRLPATNVDLALAALTHAARLRRGSAEAIVAVARSAGWVAHALEEYDAKPALRFRVRAVYTGEQPEGG